MKIVHEINTIFFSTPSEYNKEKEILKNKGWRENKKDFILTGNGIYATFFKSNI